MGAAVREFKTGSRSSSVRDGPPGTGGPSFFWGGLIECDEGRRAQKAPRAARAGSETGFQDAPQQRSSGSVRRVVDERPEKLAHLLVHEVVVRSDFSSMQATGAASDDLLGIDHQHTPVAAGKDLGFG